MTNLEKVEINLALALVQITNRHGSVMTGIVETAIKNLVRSVSDEAIKQGLDGSAAVTETITAIVNWYRENIRPDSNDPTAVIKFAAEQLAANYLPPKSGFILLSFEFGPDSQLNYVANADRKDCINLLKEFLIKCGAAEDWMKHLT